MKISAVDEYGIYDIFDVLFSFEFQDNYYIVYQEDEVLLCNRVKWNCWSGIKIIDMPVSTNVRVFANTLYSRRKINSKFYTMCGEHYKITGNNAPEGHSVRKVAKYKSISKIMQFIPQVLRWLFAMILAFAYAWIYARGKGLMWSYSLFPNAMRETLLYGMYFIQFLGTTLIFLFKKEERSIWDLCINALVPLNIITLIGTMKSSKDIRELVVFVFIGAVIFYIAPKIKNAIFASKGSKRLRNIRSIFSRSYNVLFACVIIGMITSSFFGISGYTYRGGFNSTFSDVEIISERYKAATSHLNENTWPDLTEKEKIDILQSICDYECISCFGCDTVTVQTGYPESKYVLGAYNHATRTISINLEHLENDHVSDILDTLLHEARHVWQNTIVDMYENIKSNMDEKYMNLALFEQARNFQYSFDTYQSGADYDAYYYQLVESDSRAWAEDRIKYVYDQYIYIEHPKEKNDADVIE